MQAGSVAALSKTADVALSQAWSRHFYEHRVDYGDIDGLLYLNAHNDDEALVLYERADRALRCPRNRIVRLDHFSLRPALFETADLNNLDVTPY